MIDVPSSASPTVARAITTARKLIAGATSENTRRSYETQFVAVPRLENGRCAAAAVEPWLAIREQKQGALFVTFSPHGEIRRDPDRGRLVAEVVEQLFRDAGVLPRDIDAIGAHISAKVTNPRRRLCRGDHRADHGRDGASGSEVVAPPPHAQRTAPDADRVSDEDSPNTIAFRLQHMLRFM